MYNYFVKPCAHRQVIELEIGLSNGNGGDEDAYGYDGGIGQKNNDGVAKSVEPLPGLSFDMRHYRSGGYLKRTLRHRATFEIYRRLPSRYGSIN